MAVTSIWYVNCSPAFLIDYAINPAKTHEEIAPEISQLHTVGNVIEYAADDLKTETRELVTCLGCISVETATKEFMDTKRYWNKLGGRVCFHGYQSFRPGEVDAATAHEIGVKLAKEFWGDDFQVIVATHCNTNCYHNHFVVNSVSWRNGHHYHNAPDEQKRFREISDTLCKRYRLSVIENPKGRRRDYSEYMAEKEGRPTYRGTIRGDIDRTIRASLTMEEFFRSLTALGYTLKLTGTYGTPLAAPGIRPPGGKRFMRFDTLGDGYDLENIKERILQNTRREVPFSNMEQEKLNRQRAQTQPDYRKHVTGLRGLYLRYCFELKIIRTYPASAHKLSSYMRYELTRLNRLDAETILLAKHRIESLDDLKEYRSAVISRMGMQEQERTALRNDLRRAKRRGDTAGVENASEQIASLSDQLRQARKEVDLCDDIAKRSAQVREELERYMDAQEHEQGKEETRWHTQTTPQSRS